MSQSETQIKLYMIKGMIAELPAEKQSTITQLAAQIKAMGLVNKDEGPITMALASLEFALEYEQKGNGS